LWKAKAESGKRRHAEAMKKFTQQEEDDH